MEATYERPGQFTQESHVGFEAAASAEGHLHLPGDVVMSRVSLVLHSLLCRRCARVETLSAHAHGERHRRRWRAFEAVADAVFRWFGPGIAANRGGSGMTWIDAFRAVFSATFRLFDIFSAFCRLTTA